MLNIIWLVLILASVIFGVVNGTLDAVVAAVTDSAKLGFEVALGLAGLMGLWLGIMRIADESGLVQLFAKAIYPILKRLFPDVPHEHRAFGSMTLNIAANMLGLNNAATPLGLRAMEDLESLNDKPGVATNAMCTFLAINTSSVQLIPASAIAFLAAAGASDPTSIITSGLIATSCSTIAGVLAVKLLARLPYYRSHVE